MTEQRIRDSCHMWAASLAKQIKKHLQATDKLLLDVLMGDVDPMQAMIDRHEDQG
jgi:hypothetical protein